MFVTDFPGIGPKVRFGFAICFGSMQGGFVVYSITRQQFVISIMKHIYLLSITLLVLWGCGTENTPTFTLTTTVSPVGAGTILPTQTSFNKGETAVLEAVPNNGWSFVRWEGDLTSTVNPVNLGMTRDYNIIGVFERRNYALTVTIEGQGSVTERVVTAKSTDYPFETIVELTPVAAEGWIFKEWSGDLTGSQNPARITITAPKSVTAKFITTPSVSTLSPSELTSSGAKVFGNVTSNGGATVTARGICYSTSQNPTLSNTCVASGNGTGEFNATINGLNFATQYFVRAYATNSVGTSYGSQLSFTTLPIPPSVVTGTVTNITALGASVSAEVTQTGGGTVTSRGVCYLRDESQTSEETCVNNGSGIGVFNTTIIGLQHSTKYRVRGFATNVTGTAHGEYAQFTTADNVILDIDGNVYSYVQIGTQTWMASNLKTTRYRDGSPIPNVTNSTAWSGLSSGAWANYDNNAAYDAIYGKLYNWYAVSDSRNLCPLGWHVPSDAEWTVLSNFLGTDVGFKMKATSGWGNNGNGSNASGFTGLPGGARNGDGTFDYVGRNGYFWSSTQFSTGGAWLWSLFSDLRGLNRGNLDKKHGFSVRCIRD